MAKERKTAGGRKSNSARRIKSGASWEPDSRDLDIYHKHCKGISQPTIAKEWGITQQRVSKIVQRINEWLVPQYLSRIKNIKAEHTERLMIIFSEAMEAWRRSKEDAVTEEETFSGGLPQEEAPVGKAKPKSKPVDSKRVRKGQAGGAQYLSEARAALAEIRKIWGADSQISDSGAGEERVAGRSREEVAMKIAERLEKLSSALRGEQ